MRVVGCEWLFRGSNSDSILALTLNYRTGSDSDLVVSQHTTFELSGTETARSLLFLFCS
jgi:hypothetical protein